MDFRKLFMKDSSGEKSVTVTAFILGFLTVNFKLLVAGMTFGKYTMAPFTGIEYGAALGALGAIYVMRRAVNNKTDKPDG